ncbi:MAG: DPP IV N-terminal domain-containing protein, partial [Saprospiraceae bacterium]|nr:DPP IV N-terminal domain-containing protein [Saprospiraceae bacterium]
MSYKLFFFLLAMVAFESQPKMKSATSLQQPAWLGSDNRLTTPEFLWGLTRVQIEDKTADNQFLLISLTRTDLPRDSNFTHFFLQPTHAPGSAMKQVTLPANAQKPRFHPAGKHLFFLQNDTLYVLEIATNQIQKTSDFPINEYFISADGQTMVFTKSVKYFQSMREKYADLGKADAKLFKSLNYRHWDTWRDEFRQNIFVAPFHLGRKLAPGQNLMDGEPYDAQNISCSANGQMILYDAKKVTPNEQTLGTNTDVYLYDVNSNKTTNLSDGMLGYDQNAVFTPDGRGVAWNSMATAGYETDRNRIFFYELKTGRA